MAEVAAEVGHPPQAIAGGETRGGQVATRIDLHTEVAERPSQGSVKSLVSGCRKTRRRENRADAGLHSDEGAHRQPDYYVR